MASISSPFRLFATKIPFSLQPRIQISPQTPNLCFFFRPITFQKIRTRPSSASSQSGSVPLQPVQELPPKLQEIVKLFQLVEDPKSKYEQLLFYAKNMKALDAQFKTSENKVQGCVSQVWVRAYLDSDRNVVYEADSDSLLTKGLAALLVQGLSGRPVHEVLRVTPDFVVLLGLQQGGQGLTASRNNGFLNMLKLMQRKALELFVESEKSSSPEFEMKSESKVELEVENGDGGLKSEMGGNDLGVEGRKIDEPESNSRVLGSRGERIREKLAKELNPDFESKSESKVELEVENGDGGLRSELGGSDLEVESRKIDEPELNSRVLGRRGERMREKLAKELNPVELEVEDVSYQHAGHAGARGSDGETHFNVKVVSEEFEGKSMVKRHRLVYKLLQEELQGGLHALSIVAKTPSEVS